MTPKPTIFTKVVEPMNKEAHNLVLFLLAMFAATWTTYFMIVFNGWDPYTMPGMVFLLIGGSAPSWVGVLMVLFTYDVEILKMVVILVLGPALCILAERKTSQVAVAQPSLAVH